MRNVHIRPSLTVPSNLICGSTGLFVPAPLLSPTSSPAACKPESGAILASISRLTSSWLSQAKLLITGIPKRLILKGSDTFGVEIVV
jgi:hypothetical protein